MKQILMERFDYIDQAEEFANLKADIGYRVVSLNTCEGLRGFMFLLCMEYVGLDESK